MILAINFFDHYPLVVETFEYFGVGVVNTALCGGPT